MIRKALLFATFIILSATSAVAATQDAGLFSAELPDGWKYEFFNDDTHEFIPPARGAMSVYIVINSLEGETLADRADTESEGYPVKMLPGGKNFILEVGYNGGSRIWGAQADDGKYVAIKAYNRTPGIQALIASLKAKPGQDALARVFQAAKSKDVVDWLTYATPHYIDAEMGLTLFSGNGFSAKLPKGWVATPEGGSVLFAFPGESEYGSILARAYTLPDGEYPTFVAFGKKMMKQLGGDEFMEGESGVEFTLADERVVICRAYNNKCLVMISQLVTSEDEKAVEAFSLLLDSFNIP